jgi:ABC-type dipeptide/oligopeptide/nickel transport system permease component
VTHVLPSDPVILTRGGFATEDQALASQRKSGYGKPIDVQFACCLENVMTSELGDFVSLQMPVTTALLAKVKSHFLIAILGVAFGTQTGIALSVVAAIKHRSRDVEGGTIW